MNTTVANLTVTLTRCSLAPAVRGYSGQTPYL